jgi:hypothetical protein
MKNLFTLWMLLFSFVITGTAQTTIPNSNFEQWTGNTPQGWDVSNFQIGFFNIVNVFHDTLLPMQGTSCARVETRVHNLGVATPTIPGIITLGTINIDFTSFTGTVEDGIPFTGRPTSLKGFIDATPANGDSAMIAIGLSQWNGTTRDTIGNGLAWFADVHNEWVAFDIPITYTTTALPDSMNIIISSSAVGVNNYVAGSKLRIDSLVFDYGNIMVPVVSASSELKVWANGGKKVFVELAREPNTIRNVEVFSTHGTLVFSRYEVKRIDTAGYDLSHLRSGVYVVRITTNEGRTYGQKIVLR